jgi:hypothetical protein
VDEQMIGERLRGLRKRQAMAQAELAPECRSLHQPRAQAKSGLRPLYSTRRRAVTALAPICLRLLDRR